jgi:hypothetical protein
MEEEFTRHPKKEEYDAIAKKVEECARDIRRMKEEMRGIDEYGNKRLSARERDKLSELISAAVLRDFTLVLMSSSRVQTT